MVDNLPLKTLKHNGLTVEGYSRAAVQTYWRVPELKVGFDLGGQPWSFMGTDTWFVSHGHLDHIVCIAQYVSRRRLMKMAPPVIYMPASVIGPVRNILNEFTRIDRGRMPCDLRPLTDGEEIDLTREHVVTVSATKHGVPSFGFVVWNRRKKLKPEFQDKTGEEIRDIRLSGTEVSEEHRKPVFAYLGDSAPSGLDACPAMYDAEILIAEMTFVAPDHRREKIHKFGHMHLDDFLDRRDRFKNEIIIASHLSTRYHENRVRSIVEKRIPDMLGGRLHLWL